MRGLALAAVVVGCGSSPATAPPDAPDVPADAPALLELEMVATGLVDPGNLAVDATHVYFVHGASAISRVPKPGGTVEPMATGQRGPTSLDVTSANLVWVNTGLHASDFLDGSVRWMPKSGGPDVELAQATLPSAVVVDVGGTTVFWCEVDGHGVREIQLDGSGARTIDEATTHKTSIAITPSRLAWTASGTADDVVTVDRPSNFVRTLSTVEYSPGSVVIASDDVFWLEIHVQSDLGAIRVSRGGGLATDLVPDEYYPTSLVRDDAALYWTSNGRIRKIARAGGTAVTLTEGRGAIGGLALDATHLYWTEPEHGAIVRAIK